MMSDIDATDPSAWLDAGVERDPTRLLIDSPKGRSYTYASAYDMVRRMALAIKEFGLSAGDRVAVQVEKSPEAFLLYLACLKGGFIFVPLNTAYTEGELSHFLGDSEPGLLVVRPGRNIDDLAMAMGVRHLATLGSHGDGTLLAIARRIKVQCEQTGVKDPDEVAALLYTSGTTGRPKGAMLTRRNLASNAAALVKAWRFEPSDVVLHALPIFHAHGLFILGNTALAAGAGVIFIDVFDPATLIGLMSRATVFMGVPTHYTRLLASATLTPDATASIRLFVSGSAPLLVETHRQFERKTGHRILERYAMTETIVIASNPYAGERRPGAVGFPLSGVSIRLSDPESGEIMTDQGSVGMIETNGPNRFAGYWRNPDKSAEDIREDGFFKTGDLGRFDEEGYLNIVGRVKDLVISGGYNVYPIEVESELDQLAGIAEAAVIGLPHPDFGEGVTAVAVLEPGATTSEAELLEAMRDRLARYKQPKRILFVEEFPRNALGKIQKNVLRERFQALYK